MPRDFSMYFIIIIVIVLLDQVIKRLVIHKMNLNETIPIIDHVFHITYIQNRGAAFSMLSDFPILLIALPFCVIAAGLIFLFIKRKTLSSLCQLAIAFIIAGGLGNFIDRIAYGYVTDYLDLQVFAVFKLPISLFA